MKQIKILSAVLFLLVTSTTFAQDLKGRWIVGSKVLSISSSSNQFNLTFDPSLGKYISNKVGIGAVFEFDYIKPKDGESLVNWSAGPFLKYYFLKLSEKSFLYTRARILYGKSESLEVVDSEKKVIYDNFTTEGIGLGFATILNNHLSMEFEPGIALTQKNNKTNSDLTFDIRFEYRFGGK